MVAGHPQRPGRGGSRARPDSVPNDGMTSDPTTISKAVQVSVNGVTADQPVTRSRPPDPPRSRPRPASRGQTIPCSPVIQACPYPVPPPGTPVPWPSCRISRVQVTARCWLRQQWCACWCGPQRGLAMPALVAGRLGPVLAGMDGEVPGTSPCSAAAGTRRTASRTWTSTPQSWPRWSRTVHQQRVRDWASWLAGARFQSSASAGTC